MNDCKTCVWFPCIDIKEECDDYIRISNWINLSRMSKEELATWLNCMQSNAYHCGEYGRPNKAYPFNNADWLRWLGEEVIDEEDENCDADSTNILQNCR